MTETIKIEWRTFEIGPGLYIEPDEWAHGAIVIPEDDGFCEMRLEGAHCAYAIEEIRVTGRKLRKRYGETEWVRVEVELKNEDEPNTVIRGFACAR